MREDLFLLILSLLLVAGLLWVFVRRPVYAQLQTIRTRQAAAEDELEIQRYMAQRKESMKSQMENEPRKKKGQLGSYNNLPREIEQLSQILAAAGSYDLTFSEEEMAEDMVYRDIFISYEAASYEQAQAIIEEIENGAYCCLIKDVELTRGTDSEDGAEGREMVYGNLQVTYYETVDVEKKNKGGDGQSS